MSDIWLPLSAKRGPKAGDAEYDGFRAAALWAVFGVDPADDQEGLFAVPAPGDMGVPEGAPMPLVASDQRRADTFLAQAAVAVAREAGRAAVLARFTLRENVRAWDATGREVTPAPARPDTAGPERAQLAHMVVTLRGFVTMLLEHPDELDATALAAMADYLEQNRLPGDVYVEACRHEAKLMRDAAT